MTDVTQDGPRYPGMRRQAKHARDVFRFLDDERRSDGRQQGCAEAAMIAERSRPADLVKALSERVEELQAKRAGNVTAARALHLDGQQEVLSTLLTGARMQCRKEPPSTVAYKMRVNGRAALLRQQLALRFAAVPRDAEERLYAATPEQLDAYAARTLTAKTLADVFAA